MKQAIAEAIKYIFDAPDKERARSRANETLDYFQQKAPRFCTWLDENVEECLTVYTIPKPHRKRLRTSNMLERVNQEIKRRTRVARLFPNDAACLRLITAILLEHHEHWITGKKYLAVFT